MISFLIVLRIAPLPPHWVVNVVCPHVGISIVPFWISTALGILGVSVIHTTIGGGLDEMTSADDFHLISWRNFFGLAAVVVGVLIPVGLRYWFRKEVDNVVDQPEAEEGALMLVDSEGEESDIILARGPPRAGKKDTKAGSVAEDDDDEEFDDYEDDDEDVILEAGPAIPSKDSDDDTNAFAGSSSRR